MNHYKSSPKLDQNLEQEEILANMKEWLVKNSIEPPRVTNEELIDSIGGARQNIDHTLQAKAKAPLTVESAAAIINQQSQLAIPSHQYTEAIKKTDDFLRQYEHTLYEPGQLVHPHAHWEIMRRLNMNESDMTLISKTLCMRGLMGKLDPEDINKTFITLEKISKMNEEVRSITHDQLDAWSAELPIEDDLTAPETPFIKSNKALIN